MDLDDPDNFIPCSDQDEMRIVIFAVMERVTLFADVLLPIPVAGTFTYRIPFDMNNVIVEGQRVAIQFGKRRVLAGLVKKIHENVPTGHIPKYILSILDSEPLVLPIQFQFWKWISEYYMSTEGEVMAAAMPSVFKLSSESKVVLHPGFVPDREMLSSAEYHITEALLQTNKLSIAELTDLVGIAKILPILKTMIENHLIVMEEELADTYKPKKEKIVKLTDWAIEEDNLRQVMDELGKRAHKQLELLMAFIGLVGFPLSHSSQVVQQVLLAKAGVSVSILKTLVEKAIMQIEERDVSRILPVLSETITMVELSPHQQVAYDSIIQQFEQKEVVLLHGVTSGGKTEVYIRLMERCLEEGKQVLYLLPEIALTTQIITRLQKYFGDQVGIYHSRFGKNERAEVWLGLNSNTPGHKPGIILGPRSAIFLPFDNLGLIIVDEEHDASYKQFDPSPRYHARDAAIYLALLHQSKVLLGSATPSIETYYNALQGKYGLATITERYGGIKMPEICVVDMREQTRRRMVKSLFSSVLLNDITQAIKNDKQAILFQNRRGFSLRIECDTCHWVPECKHCDVTLTYHKRSELLKCHYCGYSITVPPICPDCKGTGLKMKGFGTEKVEEELSILLPDAKIDRMDYDTTRSKNGFQKIMHKFENRETNVLTGTQMVTKGLDFDHVHVVGVLSADSMLSYPDFRAHERSFQMMAQVSGRAGRKGKQGKVIIQAWKPQHPIIQLVLKNDYLGMYQLQIYERQQYYYPPFYRMIVIRLKHKDPDILNDGAASLGRDFRKRFGKFVYGPEYPLVSRVKNLYIKQLLIKFPRSINSYQVKQRLYESLDQFRLVKEHRSIMVQFDVDPQ